MAIRDEVQLLEHLSDDYTKGIQRSDTVGTCEAEFLMDLDNVQKCMATDRLTSGRGLTSGFYVYGDHPLTSGLGAPNPFMIGDGLDIPSAMPFRLSPRIYQVSRVDDCQTASADVVAAFKDIPNHLVFRESPQHERFRQCWVSDDVCLWHWELVLVLTGKDVAATLKATAPSEFVGVRHLIWRADGIWDFFGSNRVESSGCADQALIVSAL